MNRKLPNNAAGLPQSAATLARAILATGDMERCDRFAVAAGVPGTQLMERAGYSAAEEIRRRWAPRRTVILCGPGNNGGDGYVIARHLEAAAWPVSVVALNDPAGLNGDARWAFEAWGGRGVPPGEADFSNCELVVDALFGAGLQRPLGGEAARLVEEANAARAVRVAVDLPSGLAGDLDLPSDIVFKADLSVTFHRAKPAHRLAAGRKFCGEVVVCRIGIPDGWEVEVSPLAILNSPEIWDAYLPVVGRDTHKHQRGRLVVFSGAAGSTGAARLSADTGLRAGAGLVTVIAPAGALVENASHLTAVMLAERCATVVEDLEQSRASASVLGPAFGVGEDTRRAVEQALSVQTPHVLDADALSSFAGVEDRLFTALRPFDVITPHVGEFERLFPQLLARSANRIDAARTAAVRAGCTVLLKGPDTVIAHPAHTPVVNTHATPALATAGSGDVLAGLIGGLVAQGMDSFGAAAAACWIHGEAGRRMGAGLTAEDLPLMIACVIADLHRQRYRKSVLKRLTEHG